MTRDWRIPLSHVRQGGAVAGELLQHGTGGGSVAASRTQMVVRTAPAAGRLSGSGAAAACARSGGASTQTFGTGGFIGFGFVDATTAAVF